MVYSTIDRSNEQSFANVGSPHRVSVTQRRNKRATARFVKKLCKVKNWIEQTTNW